MCEHCGCRQVEPIGELMEEHFVLLEEGGRLREALGRDDPSAVASCLNALVEHLDQHVRREEAGIFAALRTEGEFAEEVAELEGEHRSFDSAVSGLAPAGPDFERRVTQLLRELNDHVERENLGIFPVSVVTLGADGWETVREAHQRHPSFLEAGVRTRSEDGTGR